jgi:sec-independent protein translocase protein TatA
MPSIGAPEIILVIVVLVLLFGAKKLPDLARGSGRALRIFKAETKGLGDDDEETGDEPVKRQEQSRQPLPPSTDQSPNGTESSDASQPTRDQQQS